MNPWEWMWRGEAFARARRSKAVHLSAVQQDRFALACRAWAAASLFGSYPESALGAYREAAYWALRALDDAESDVSPSDLDPDGWVQGEDAATLRTLLTRDFVWVASLDHETRTEWVSRARGAVQRLLARGGDRRRVDDLTYQRWTRTVAVALVLGLGGLTGARIVSEWSRGPDLARLGTYKASSTVGGYDVEGVMNAAHPNGPLFHTGEEQNPWVQIDLGKLKTFHRIEIGNRRDCCKDRALPLVITASTDGKTWTDVARIVEPFNETTVTFAPRQAQFIRLQVPRKSFLHLDAFRVR